MLSTDVLSEIADREGVPLSLVLATYHVESDSGQADTSQPHGKENIRGGFQVADNTFREMMPSGADPNDEYSNAVAGIRYLRQGLDKTGGDTRTAYMYYHGGPNQQNWGPKTNAAADQVASYVDTLESHQTTTTGSISGGMPSKAAFSGPIDFSSLVSDIQGGLQETRKAAAETSAATERYQADYNSAAQVEVAATGGVGQAQSGVAAALRTMQAQQSTGVLNNLANLGLNDESLTNEQARLSQAIRDGTTQVADLRSSLNQKAAAVPDFLSNPIGWIVGNYGMRDDIALHNNAQAQIDENRKNLEALTSSSSAITAANLPKIQAAKTSVALAEALVHVEQANVDQAKIRKEAAGANATFAERNLANNIQIMQLRNSELRALESVQGMQDREQNMQEKKDLAFKKQQADDATLETANSALDMLGQPRVNSIHELDKIRGPRLDALNAVAKSGGARYGEDAVSAYQNLAIGNPKLMPLGTRSMMQFDSEAYDQANALAEKDPLHASWKKEEKQYKVSEGMKDLFKKWQEKTDFNPIAGVDGNPYRAPPLEAMLADPTFKNTMVAKLLTETKAQNPAVPISDKFVIATVTNEFLSGQRYNGSVEAATKDLEDYFKNAIALNNTTNAFDKMNLPPQKTYMLGGKDWSKRATIATALARAGATKASQDLNLENLSNMSQTP